jgi:DNA-binding transcriptional LysR family regulator
MNLETLRLYCDVVRSNSFSLGAAANRVSQSAASQAVRQLEEDLGVQLIDRTKRPFGVTQEGAVFFEACQDIVERLERARAELNAHRTRVEGVVRVAVIYSVGLEDMGWYTERFTALHSRARLRLAYLHPDEVVEAVLSDTADLGILSFPTPHRSLTTIPWRSEAMVLVCPPGHPLAEREEVTADEVARYPFVAFDRALSIRRAIDRALRRQGVRLEVAMHFDNIETIKQAISTQSCISILPQPSIRREVEEGVLSAVPVDLGGLVRPVGIIHRRQRELSATTRSLLEFLEQYRPGDVVGMPN